MADVPATPRWRLHAFRGTVVAAAALMGLVAVALALQEGEASAHLARLFALIAALILWIGEIGPRGPSALLLLVFVELLGLASSQAVFAGFGQPAFLFVVAVLGISSAIGTVGTTTRLMQRVLGGGRAGEVGSSRAYVWQLPLLMLASASLVSSATARVSLLHPVLNEMVEAARAEPGLRRYLTLFVANLSPITSRAFLSGGPGIVVAAGLMARAGQELGWGDWALWMGVPVALLFGLSTLGHLAWLRPGPLTRLDVPRDPFTRHDAYVGAVVAGLVALWIVGPNFGVGSTQVALMGMAALMLLPQSEAIVRGMDWNLVLFAGATLSFAGVLLESGTAAWLGHLLFTPLREVGNPLLATVAVFTVLVALRLPLSNGVSYSAMVFPIVLSLGDIGGVATLHIAFMALVAGGLVFLPVQSNPTMISFASGRFGVIDTIRSGAITFAAALVVFQWVAIPYWTWLGR